MTTPISYKVRHFKLRRLFIINIIAILNVVSTIVHAQATNPANLPQVVPLSPNAAEFAKYGNIPVSASTGTPNISIPIYEINTGKIKVPITLSYHASGILVSQKATWVGLGWSLNAGGIISRSVRGLEDEKNYGWMNEQNTVQNINNSGSIDELGRYADNATDASPDFFTYSLPSISGRFVYSQAKSSFQTIPMEPVKVTHLTAGGGANIDNTYQITDVDGNNYYYLDKQVYFNDTDVPIVNYTQSWYLSKIISADTKDTVQFNYTTSTTLGGGSEEDAYTEIHTYTTDDGGSDASIPVNTTYIDKGISTQHTVFYHGYVALKEIIFKQGKVAFYANTPRKDYLGCMLDSLTIFNKSGNVYTPVYKYQLNHDYFVTSQPFVNELDYRLRLLSLIKIPVVSNGSAEKHSFSYNNTPLPSINAKSMDYWGYYNGTNFNAYLPHILPGAPELSWFVRNNQYIGGGNRDESDDYIQAGVLQKIVYPTNGYTVFTYEPHQYITDQTQTTSTIVSSGSLTGAGRKVIKTNNINFNWPANALNNTGVFAVTLSPYTNPASLDDVPQRVTLTDLTTNTMMWTWVHDGNMPTSNAFTSNFVFDPTHNYQVKLAVNDDAPTSVSFSLTAQIVTTGPVLKKGGGLRIASMQNFSNDNSLLSTEKYSYLSGRIGKNDNLIANNYSKKAIYSSAAIKGTSGGPIGCATYTYYTINYYGTASYGGQNFEGANCLYDDVVKTNYDNNNNPNGKTEYNYNIGQAFSTIENSSMPGGKEYIDNSLGQTALPIKESFYKSNQDGSFVLLKSKAYVYGGGVAIFKRR